MSKKVLLVTSSFEDISLITASSRQGKGLKIDENTHYPLGLAYLHSYLENKGNYVKTLFLNHINYFECFAKVKEEIKNFSPEFIGFQMLTANRVSTYELIEYVHVNYPRVRIVLGGVHATILYKQLIEKFPYLIVVIGEGEITFSELIKELSKKRSNLGNIAGIAFCSGSQVIVTKQRGLINNLDQLPFPKHEIYFESKNRKRGNILTIRGCPFNCSFCCLDTLSRGKVRKRSVGNIITEIEWMVKKFPTMDTIWIHDDSFLLDNKRVINFCDEVVIRKIKLNFICSARVKPLSEQMIKKMEKANFKLILIGVESCNEDILRKCHKGITKNDILNAVKLFSKSKIMLSIFLIVGLPGEDIKTIKETIAFTKKLQKIKYFYFSEDVAVLTVYPGTEVYELARVIGAINDDYWLSKDPTPLFTIENNKEMLFYFKDILLNNISLDRFLTLHGFASQYMMLPYIVKFFFLNIKFFWGNKSIIIKKILRIFQLSKNVKGNELTLRLLCDNIEKKNFK